MIKVLFEEEFIIRKEIFKELDLIVRAFGRQSYNQIINTSYDIYADDTLSPQCLAYAISVGELSDKERSLIKYDRETEKKFVSEQLKENLLEHFFTLLITKREPWPTRPFKSISDCSCC